MLAKPSTSPTSPMGTISDLDKFIFNPDTASKHKNMHLKFQKFSTLGSQKINISSANNKCDTTISSWFLNPTENSDKSPLSAVAAIILLNASIITPNNSGDNGPSYLNPRELLKNHEGEPLMRMENRTVEMQ
jgi:hypothetical protein